jgi:photosystem II stability/assembly factor-like uncharacterized protein
VYLLLKMLLLIVLGCKKLILVFLIGVVTQTVAQQKLPKYKWVSLGPFETPVSGVDSGVWTANGVGWIEHVVPGNKKEKRLYAGSNVGGMFVSKNSGKTWKFRFDVDKVCGVWDIAVDPKNKKRLWVATATNTWDSKWGRGILYSTNGGKKWKGTGLTFSPMDKTPMYCVEQSTVNTQLFYACSATDIYKSSDKTESWTKVYDRDAKARVNFRHLDLHNTEPNKVIASGALLLTSVDGGKNWESQQHKFTFQQYKNKRDSLPSRFAYALNPQNNNQIVVVYSYKRINYIDRSDDFGKTWYNVLRNRDFDRVDINHAEMVWHPTDSNQMVVGSVRLYKSTNQGKSFDLVSAPVWKSPQFMHDDIRSLMYTANGHLLVGNDGGVSLSKDEAQTWITLNGYGLQATQFYDIAVDSGRIVGGCQDLSSMIYQNNVWYNTSTIYGDGGMNLIRGEDIYVMQNGMRLRKGNFTNTHWEVIYTPYRPKRFKYPFVFSPLNSEKVWATDHDIWELQARKNWLNLTKDVPHGFTKIVGLDVSDTDSNVVYFAKDQPTWDPSEKGLVGKLYKGKRSDTGYDWIDITNTLPILAWREITSIVSNPLNSDEVFVALYGFDDGEQRHRVYKSIDGGQTWMNYSEGLPNLNALKMILVEGSTHRLLATDEGVYYRRNNSDKWMKLEGKIPNAHVIDLEFDIIEKAIYAATFGNGIWKLDFSSFLE